MHELNACITRYLCNIASPNIENAYIQLDLQSVKALDYICNQRSKYGTCCLPPPKRCAVVIGKNNTVGMASSIGPQSFKV